MTSDHPGAQSTFNAQSVESPSDESSTSRPSLINQLTRNGRRVKLPLVVIFMSVMIAIVSWFSANDIARRTAEFNRLALDSRNMIEQQLASRVEMEARAMAMTLRTMSTLEGLADPFLTGDRQALLQTSRRVFLDLNKQFQITHLYFTGADRVNVLRVHNPSFYGDMINRGTQIEAEKTGEISSGLEMGASGRFTLRVVAPWRIDGELVGYIEIGKEILHILSAITGDTGLQLIKLIDKSVLDEAQWRQFASASGHQSDWDRLPDSIVVSRDIYDEQIPEMRQLATGPLIQSPLSYSKSGRHFTATVLPLRDMTGNAVGRIITVREVTEETHSFQIALILDVLVATSILLVSMVLVGKVVGQVEDQVAHARDNLENTVAARTAELVAANTRLSDESNKRSMAQEKSAFFARILEDSWNEIYIFAPKTFQFIHANRGALSNMGYTLDEMKELTAKSIKPDFTLEEFRAMVQPLVDGTERFCIFEARHMRKDGTTYPVEVRLQFMAHESPPVFVAVINDISDRKIAEAEIQELNTSLEKRVEERTIELREAQETLVQSEKMAALGNLVAGVAHEVNTPVGVGITAVTHMSEELKTLMTVYRDGSISQEDLEHFMETSSEATQIIEHNLTRASNLIRSFKLVAVDQSHEDVRQINVRDYTEDVLMSLRPRLRKVNCKVHLDCPKDIKVKTDPGALAQIITNIVTNSVIHAFEGRDSGDLWVKIAQDRHNGLNLSFQDNGVGIPQPMLKKIFDPFITSKRGDGGTGLGLHILHNIVTQKLQGTVRCSSEPGEGTRFDICVPKFGSAQAPAPTLPN